MFQIIELLANKYLLRALKIPFEYSTSFGTCVDAILTDIDYIHSYIFVIGTFSELRPRLDRMCLCWVQERD